MLQDVKWQDKGGNLTNFKEAGGEKKELRKRYKFNGEGLWTRFMRRHPELSSRTSDRLSHCTSSSVSQPVLDYYFELLLRKP